MCNIQSIVKKNQTISKNLGNKKNSSLWNQFPDNKLADKSRKNAFKKLPWREQFKKYSYNNKKAQQWLVRRLRQLRLIHPNLNFVEAKKHRLKIKHYSWLSFKPHIYSKSKRHRFSFLYCNGVKKYHSSKVYPFRLRIKRFFYGNRSSKLLQKINYLKKEITHFPVFLKTSPSFLVKNNAYTIFKNFKYIKYQNIVYANSSVESNLNLFTGKLNRGLFFFSTTYKKKKNLFYKLKSKISKNFSKNLYINEQIKRNYLFKKHKFNDFLGHFKNLSVETKQRNMLVHFYNKQRILNKVGKRLGSTELLPDLNPSPENFEKKKPIKIVWRGFLKYKTRFFVSNTEFLNSFSKSKLDLLKKKKSVHSKKLKLRFKKQLVPFFGNSKKTKTCKRKNYIDDRFVRMLDIHKLSNSGINLYKILRKTQHGKLNKSQNKRLRKRKVKKRVRKLRFILGYKRPKFMNFSLPRHVEFNYKTLNGIHLGYSNSSSASYRIPFWLSIGKLTTFLSY